MNKEIQEVEYMLILLYIIKRYHLLETAIEKELQDTDQIIRLDRKNI